MNVRWMNADDLPQVSRLVMERSEKLRAILSHNQNIGIVCEHCGKIVGAIIYRLEDDHFHVLYFRTWQFHASRELVREMKEKTKKQKRKRVVFDVKESNLDLQLFLKDCGFVATEVRDGYYTMQYDAMVKL